MVFYFEILQLKTTLKMTVFDQKSNIAVVSARRAGNKSFAKTLNCTTCNLVCAKRLVSGLNRTCSL